VVAAIEMVGAHPKVARVTGDGPWEKTSRSWPDPKVWQGVNVRRLVASVKIGAVGIHRLMTLELALSLLDALGTRATRAASRPLRS
jgi:hypothetical protein